MSVQSLTLPVFWVGCDQCGAASHELVDAPLDDGLAIEQAVSKGWHHANDLNFYCPDCVPTLEVCS